MNDTERIAELEAQVSRLQGAFIGLWGDFLGGMDTDAYKPNEDFCEIYGLHPGDLDPLGGDDELPR